jgi:antitoxin ChpS
MVTIPKPMLETLGLSAETLVGMWIDDGKLVIEPSRRRRYALSELLARCDPAIPAEAEAREWDEAEAVGREAI